MRKKAWHCMHTSPPTSIPIMQGKPTVAASCWWPSTWSQGPQQNAEGLTIDVKDATSVSPPLDDVGAHTDAHTHRVVGHSLRNSMGFWRMACSYDGHSSGKQTPLQDANPAKKSGADLLPSER